MSCRPLIPPHRLLPLRVRCEGDEQVIIRREHLERGRQLVYGVGDGYKRWMRDVRADARGDKIAKREGMASGAFRFLTPPETAVESARV
jgi:hypothetical protein